MENLREFLEQIIFIAITLIFIELILPKGNTKKYIYVILSLFVLLNVISPIVDIINDADMQNIYDDVLGKLSTAKEEDIAKDIAVFSEYKKGKVEESMHNELKKDITEKLSNMNIELKDIKFSLNDNYSFENLEITIDNLDYLGENKKIKISDIITTLEKEYNLQNNVIKITEEAN